MQTIKLKRDDSIEKWIKVNKPFSKVNKSHFQIAQTANPILIDSTTYNENWSSKTPNNLSTSICDSGNMHNEAKSSIILGFQKEKVVSEAKDKFSKIPKQNGVHRYSHTTHTKSITPYINPWVINKDDNYLTTDKKMRSTSLNFTSNGFNKAALKLKSNLNPWKEGISTHFALGYTQYSRMSTNHATNFNKTCSDKKFRATYGPSSFEYVDIITLMLLITFF